MSGHHPWPPPRSKAHNIEWDWADSPYQYPPMESDVCACDSKLCVDCSPTEQIKQGRVTHHESDAALLASLGATRLWLTFYKLKRWILKRLGR
jgi:hypothetical protein